MFRVNTPSGHGRCDWCKLQYGDNRRMFGFVSFVDPSASGLRTVYGLVCCEHCRESLYRLGAVKRSSLATGTARFSYQEKTKDYDISQKHIEHAKIIGGYPAVYLTYWESRKPNETRGIKCLQSNVLRPLSPVQGVHVCLIEWSKTKGYVPYKKKEFPLSEQYKLLPEEPNKRGKRKPIVISPR